MTIDRRTFIISTAVGAGALVKPGLAKGDHSKSHTLLTESTLRTAEFNTDKPVIPQKDPKPDARRDQIEVRRPLYQFKHGYIAPLGILRNLPERSEFSRKYLSSRAKKFVKVVRNATSLRIRRAFSSLDKVKDYETFFPVLDKPGSIALWQSDDIFAEQRLSGANPMIMRKVADLDELSGPIPGRNETWEQAMGEDRLFVCDYRILPPVKGGVVDGRRKYLPKPVAYFVYTKFPPPDQSRLLPVAIRIADGGPLLSPKTSAPDVWQYAKACVQVADGNHHEMSTHLGRTHFVMEPFAVSAERQLADLHPIKILLEPHFTAMLANNDLARNTLVNRNGTVDEILAGTLEESLSIVAWAASSYSVTAHGLEEDLIDRGIAETESLPHFPYRDDARLLLPVIHGFVKAYVELYYSSDSDVTADWELQGWVNEIASTRGGGVSGIQLPLQTMSGVVDLVTRVIFTCSAGHAAVNYTQWDWMAFVPNMPLAAYSEIAPDGAGQDLMKFFPPAPQTREQVNMLATLTKYQHDKLGDYARGAFVDPAAANLTKDFRKRLEAVENRIIDRNKRRIVPYEFLRPSLIPNSISI